MGILWLSEAITHEMGHEMDVFNDVQSSTDAYNDALVADLECLDTLGGGNPCSVGSGTAQGPFVGVTDFQTNERFAQTDN